MAIVLGIHDGHNASVVCFRDGKLSRALQEERTTGVKNFLGPPSTAIKKLLELENLTASEVDAVCIGSKYMGRPAHPHWMKENFDNCYRLDWRQRLLRRLFALKAYGKWRTEARMKQRAKLFASMGFKQSSLCFYDHHKAHAATAYYGLRGDDSPYLVLTLDGSGDDLSGSVWVGENGSLRSVARIPYQDSLGTLYAMVTHLLGFMPLEHEYKLMGMAPYASPKYAAEIAAKFKSYLELDHKNPCLFKRNIPEPTLLIGPRLERDLRHQRFDNICAGLQLFTEDLLCQWVQACVKATGINRVLASGGVFMNVKANKRVAELDEVAYFQAFPSCGDETLPFGACYLALAEAGDHVEPITHFYWGNDLTPDECQEALNKYNDLTVDEPSDMAGCISELLQQGKAVARAAGPMEFGARALGNRSILADPINQDVIRVINRMIKKRDFWMPFAPVVLRENLNEYFMNPKDLSSPYMMLTYDSSEKRQEFMAAVHNADLTARPQAVEPGQNEPYEAILRTFAERTGRKVLLNTSFNLHGFPIVCTAQDALDVFINSGLENLVLGPFLVTKKGNQN